MLSAFAALLVLVLVQMMDQVSWWVRRPPPPPPPPPPPEFQWIVGACIAILSLIAYVRQLWRRRITERLAAERAATLAAARLALTARQSFTADDLRHFDGRNERPILLCICGDVFDVTDGRIFYGPGGCYAALVGCDASRLLAKGKLEPESAEELSKALTPYHQSELRMWREHFTSKYVLLKGTVAPVPVTDGRIVP